MANPADSTELRRLEAEAHDFERKGDYLGALDAYDEIVSKGLATAQHLAARGYCYMKDRQRQQARTDWLDGLALDPGNKICREALDKYFPGWEDRKTAAPRVPRDKVITPPPPPPVSFARELTVETVSAARPAPVERPEPVARPVQPAARPKPSPSLRTGDEGGEAKVNWDFVMQDAAEEATMRRR